MRRVMITCPATDRLVPTGFEMPANAMKNSTVFAAVDCPECGKIHDWSMSDAVAEPTLDGR